MNDGSRPISSDLEELSRHDRKTSRAFLVCALTYPLIFAPLLVLTVFQLSSDGMPPNNPMGWLTVVIFYIPALLISLKVGGITLLWFIMRSKGRVWINWPETFCVGLIANLVILIPVMILVDGSFRELLDFVLPTSAAGIFTALVSRGLLGLFNSET